MHFSFAFKSIIYSKIMESILHEENLTCESSSNSFFRSLHKICRKLLFQTFMRPSKCYLHIEFIKIHPLARSIFRMSFNLLEIYHDLPSWVKDLIWYDATFKTTLLSLPLAANAVVMIVCTSFMGYS